MKGYKGFNKGLICNGKQYAENTVFEEDNAVICKSGMHFCKNPLDVLDYYSILDDNGEFNEFAEVEALDDVKTDDEKKYCTKKLKIGAKLSIREFINASVKFIFEKTEKENKSSGYYSKLASSGDNSKLASSGDSSVICAIGINSIAKATKGSWITLAEYDDENIVKCVKTEQVDGERIKADTFYKLEGGEFVESN